MGAKDDTHVNAGEPAQNDTGSGQSVANKPGIEPSGPVALVNSIGWVGQGALSSVVMTLLVPKQFWSVRKRNQVHVHCQTSFLPL